MFRQSDPAALFTADENFALEHQLRNIFEANRTLEDFQTEVSCNAREDQALRVRPRYCPTPALVSINVQKQQCKSLKRVDETAGLVHDAKAVGVAVGRQANMTARLSHSHSERLELRHHGFGIDSSEQRIRIS